jgi:hypothetical protein
MNDLVDRAKTDQAVKAVEELTRAVQEIDLRSMHLGRMLWYVKENELYKSYSEHTQTMSAFLREIDIGFGQSMAEHYIRVYKTFGEEIGTRQIPFNKLLKVVPMVRNEETKTYWLDKAEHLPYKALADEIRESRGQIASDACDHPAAAWVTHCRCSQCNQWIN